MTEMEIISFVENVREQFQNNDKISIHDKGKSFKIREQSIF